MDKSRVCHAHMSLSPTHLCVPYISHFHNASDYPVSLSYGTLWRVISKHWFLVRSLNTSEQSVVKFVLQNLSSNSSWRLDLVSKQRQCIKCLTTFLWSSVFPQLTFQSCDGWWFCWVESINKFLERKSRKY